MSGCIFIDDTWCVVLRSCVLEAEFLRTKATPLSPAGDTGRRGGEVAFSVVLLSVVLIASSARVGSVSGCKFKPSGGLAAAIVAGGVPFLPTTLFIETG